MADASKVQNGQLFALSPVPKICLTKTLNQHCATGELLCLLVPELNSNFCLSKRTDKKKGKRSNLVSPLLPHLIFSLNLFPQGTRDEFPPLWIPTYVFYLCHRGSPVKCKRESSDLSVMGKEARGVTYWQICCVHKERSTGTRVWQRPLTFTECPDVGGIPLLIHIILPSQHRCP